jgi:hypothetical protein
VGSRLVGWSAFVSVSLAFALTVSGCAPAQPVETVEGGAVFPDAAVEPLFATGKYLDVVTFEGGTAKFQERIVVLDSRQVDILLVVPI